MMRGIKAVAASGAVALSVSTLAVAAHAQSTQGQPPTREELEQPAPTQAPASRVRVDSGRALETAPCPLSNYDLKVNITQLRFTGLGGAELAPEIRQIVSGVAVPAGTQDIAVVCTVRDQANAALRQAGYIASVQIPPQTIEAGDLRLEVITAKIVDVRVRGDAPPYRGTIAARAERLKALAPLNERDAERILLLAGDIPGLDVQLSLSPAGTVPGEVVGDLMLSYRPFSVLTNVNNLGSRQLGREVAYMRAETFGLLGNQDVTYVGGSISSDLKEQRVVHVGHSGGIGNAGLRYEGNFLHAWSRPDLDQLDLRSRSWVGSLGLSMPLIRSRRRTADVTGGLELVEQTTRVYGSGGSSPLNRDKLRIAFLRSDFGMRSFLGSGLESFSLLGNLELRQGLNIFGTTETGEFEDGFTPSRFAGDATSLVVRGNLDGTINFGPVFSLGSRVRGQWANNPLLNFEEFALGNLTIGRGYDPGSNSADRAIGLRLEPRAKLFDNGRARVEGLAFYDSVWIWNLDPNAIETDRRLASYGAGLRGLLPGFGAAEVIYARPQHKALLIPGAERAPDRILFSITALFPRGGR